jgi:hypothetical protein
MVVKCCLTTVTKSPNRLFSSISLATIVFACNVVPTRPRGKVHDGKQPIAPSSALVLPINLEATTIGGIDGAVLRVTTLAADGPGSLRQALEDERPRLVVFEVGGVIDLQGQSIDVRHPWLTVAGQTAPDPGITLIRGSLEVETHDVVIQHIAVRPGDAGQRPAHGEWAPDALGTHRGNAGPVHHVVFDHCSATWAIDENLSASGPADVDPTSDPDITSHDITLRHCLIAEGLSHATHPKGEHSKGTLIHDGVRNVVIAGCLYAHNRERNPRLKGGTTSIVVGNVMYNWGAACVGVGKHGNRQTLQPSETALFGNVAIAGADTRSQFFVKSVDPGGRVFLRDNVAVNANGAPIAMTDDGVVLLAAPNVPTIHPWDAAAEVLRSAGSRPAHRDPIDARIVRSVIEGSGRIIDSQEQVGGYPVRAQTMRVASVPDGVDARRRWLDELSRALDEDAALDLAPLWKRVGVRG